VSEQLALVPGGSPLDLGKPRRLNDTQTAMLRHVGEHGSITSTEAGVILHQARGHCGFGGKGGRHDGDSRSKACCVYACSDGSMALRRLRDRGALVKSASGWVLP
jgi:hypothetical protein